MIFSVSSVCIAYCLGVLVSTFYIRTRLLVGAGFFWMMYATSGSFSLFSVISSDEKIKILSIILLLLCFMNLIITIVKRNIVKSQKITLENIINVISILLSVLILFITANQKFQNYKLLIETTRLVIGGTVLGGITTTMLLGHWYLVQPGLTRKPISKLTKTFIFVLLVDILLWLLPKSMFHVINGTISDGWGGTLGYMWIGSCVTTLALLIAAYKALQEKSYSAVMATTGLLYLAILVSNGVELIPRAIFS